MAIPYWGFLLTMDHHAWVALGGAAIIVALGYTGVPFWLWSLFGLSLLAGFGAPLWAAAAFLAVSAVFIIHPIRKLFVTSVILKVFKAMKIIPQISELNASRLRLASCGWSRSCSPESQISRGCSINRKRSFRPTSSGF